MDKKFSMGALPPKHLEWQVGKTAETIMFINAAEKFLKDKPQSSPYVELEQIVNKLKTGH